MFNIAKKQHLGMVIADYVVVREAKTQTNSSRLGQIQRYGLHEASPTEGIILEGNSQ